MTIKVTPQYNMYCDKCKRRLTHPVFNNRMGFKSIEEVCKRAKEEGWVVQKYVESLYESSDPDASRVDRTKYHNYCPKCVGEVIGSQDDEVPDMKVPEWDPI